MRATRLSEGSDEDSEVAEQPLDETPAPLADRLQAARRARRGSHLPGPTGVWVTAAVAGFVLVVGIAFGLSGDALSKPPSSSPPAVIALPPAQTEQTQSQSASEQQATEETPVVEEAADESAEETGPLLSGFEMPIAGACLTEFEGQLPNAPREYRNGTHEGVDFYTDFACLTIDHNTPVLAAKTGLVIRADRDSAGLTADEYVAAEAAGFQGDAVLDRFRGRQIWIDHGNGIVTRYAHLSAVAAGIEVGDVVRAGAVIAFVGESGTPESIFAPGTDEHLHFEIRIDDSYLGAGAAAVGRAGALCRGSQPLRIVISAPELAAPWLRARSQPLRPIG